MEGIDYKSLVVSCWSRRRGRFFRVDHAAILRVAWHLGFRNYRGTVCQLTQDSRIVVLRSKADITNAVANLVDHRHPDFQAIRAALRSKAARIVGQLAPLESFYGVRIQKSLRKRVTNN